MVLVRNEDVFVERAVRNVVEFCDRILAFDHVSTDATWPILRSLADGYDNVDAQRTHHAGDSPKTQTHRIRDWFGGSVVHTNEAPVTPHPVKIVHMDIAQHREDFAARDASFRKVSTTIKRSE